MTSHFLFAFPSWLSGMARLLDIGGQFDEYNQSRTPAEADARALYSDFRVVGDDVMAAIREFHKAIGDSEASITKLQLSLFDRTQP